MKQRIHGEVSVWIRSPPFEITILEYNDISDTLSFLLNVTSNDEVPTLLSVVLNFHFEQQQIKIILNSVWVSVKEYMKKEHGNHFFVVDIR